MMTQNPNKKPPIRKTSAGGLYDLHGPIPVPEAHESDTESAWALFQDSVQLQDNPPTQRDELRPNFEDTNTLDSLDAEADAFEPTRAAPLKP
jgi:hypothetical protein